jgi:hypothetical protein
MEYLVFPWNLADFEGGGEGGSEGEEGYCGLTYTRCSLERDALE